MSQSKGITITKPGIPIYALILLATIFAFGLFVVGYDQGHLFSVIMGETAFDELFIHELTHDMRHAAGFPCH
jgi:purine-cytosine permease-like protein